MLTSEEKIALVRFLKHDPGLVPCKLKTTEKPVYSCIFPAERNLIEVS